MFQSCVVSNGFKTLNERKIEAELGENGLDHNIQRLGYWPTFNTKSDISEKDWSALEIEEIPEFNSKLFVAVKYSQDGNNVSMSIAVRTKDEKVFVEAIDCVGMQPVVEPDLGLCDNLKPNRFF